MPVRYKLETKGFSEYLERLVQAGDDIDRIADQALEAGGDILLQGMDQRVPRDTGNLAAHLERSEPERDGNFHSVTVGLSKDADAETARYGGAQEFGWGPDHPAQPYIRPAIDEDMKTAKAAMKEIFNYFLKTGKGK
jgi:HK97 gp10 family phage protein